MITAIDSLSPIPQNDIRELSIITKISQSILNTLDMDEVLQIISDGMSELFEIESTAIYLLEDGETIYLSATTPAMPGNVPDFVRRAKIADHPHISRAIAEKRVQELNDIDFEELSPAEREIVELRNLKSNIYFPFVQQNRVTGVLIMSTCGHKRKFSRHEIELGQTVANQLSVAIENTRMHKDLAEYNSRLEEMVQEKTKDLDALIEELRAANEELYQKNSVIESKNDQLKATIANLKETQAQLLHAEKMASLGTLTAGVAHEINNPLNFIQGSYFGLKKYFDEYGSNQEGHTTIFLSNIKEGIDRAVNIINGLNQFSRNTESMTEVCDIPAIIDNCLNMLNNQIKYRIDIIKKYAPQPVLIIGNVGRLHQVFLNVLTNAVQAIKNSGVIRISTSVEQSTLEINISDTGVGISTEIISSITDPFFTTKDPGGGTGLGLSIVYKILSDHGGDIAFKSTLGEGTNVKILLPVKAGN